MTVQASLLASIVDSTMDAIVCVNERHEVVLFNQAAERMFGCPATEVLGRPLDRFLPQPFHGQHQAWVATFGERGETRRHMGHLGAVVGVRADGECFPAEVAISRTGPAGERIFTAIVRDVSERARAQEALAASEQRFSATFRTAPMPMVLVRLADLMPLEVNDAFVALTGFRLTDLTNVSLEERLRLVVADPAGLDLPTAEGPLRDVETTLLTRSGEKRHVQVNTEPIEIDGALHLVVTMLDLSARRRAEAATREAERLFVAAFRDAPVGMLITRFDGRVVQANRSLCHCLGYADGALIGMNMSQLWEDPALRQPMVDRLRQTGAAQTFELRARHQDGGTIEFVASAQIVDVDGQPHIFGVVQDVTQLRHAQETARESEQRFFDIARSIREVFWLTTLDGRQVLYVSPSYEEIWGQSCKTLLSNSFQWLDAVHPEDQARVRAASARAAEEPFDLEYRIIRPDDTVRWIHDRSFIVRDEHRQPVRVAGVAEDITERRKLQEQFQRAQKMESIGQLAGGVAHDFNNILTVIASSAHYLKEELASNSEHQGVVSEIEQAVNRATGLTRQLLAFSRKQVVEPVRLDLNKLVSDTEKMLRRLLGEDVQLTTRLSPEAAEVHADPGQLAQVLINLAVNSRDAMPNGGRLIIETAKVELGAAHAAAHLGSRTGPHVRLSVTDTGQGMSQEVQARLFEPFFTTKPQGKGTGLGLSVVFGVIQQAGGHLEVASAPGAGATFHVYLPCCGDAAAHAKAEEEPAGLAGTETVLVVEDEEAVRRAATRSLAALGYQVLEASSGDAALDLLGRHPGRIDLLVSDVVMPGLDGRRLSEKARAARPELKVLFVSGYTDDAVLRYGVSQAEVSFLNKPFTPSALAKKVRQVLDAGAPRPA